MILTGSRSCAAPAARGGGRTRLFLTCGQLAACDGTYKEHPVPNLPDIQASLAFTSAYENDKLPKCAPPRPTSGPERSFFQKFKNEPENRVAETTRTLVSYDFPKFDQFGVV